jgi:Helix-turn-helix domain
MTRRIERAMALLRRDDLSVTEVCFAAGCSSLGTFSSHFTDLVGMPPSTYRHHAARATAGMPSCVAKQVTKPIRNREAGHRAAPRVTAMNITIRRDTRSHSISTGGSRTFTRPSPAHDPDASLTFYRDTLGFEVRNDVAYGGMRWITVGPADQPGTSISGLPVRL